MSLTPSVNLPQTSWVRRDSVFGELGWMEVFVFCQFLLPGVMFLPGTQAIRTVLRVMPYISCIVLLFVYHSRVKKLSLAPGTKMLVLAMMLLALGLLHPASNLLAGLAQCVLQICIAAPIYWGMGMVQSSARLQRLLWLMLLANGISAVVGLLQTIYPGTFLPPEFASGLVGSNPGYLESMTYIGASGQKIIRPPGLNDTPGTAALAGLFTGVLGLALASERPMKRWKRFVALACAFVGITDIYLAQVRSLFLVLLIGILVFGLVRNYRAPIFSRRWIAVAGLVLVCSSYFLAIQIGGDAVSSRFLGIGQQGVYNTFQQNRGIFVAYTFDELLFQYPLGAGVGRWGIANVYFGAQENQIHPSLWAEIQITGWLYDGGILMWVLYGGAIVGALIFSYRIAARHPDQNLAELAKVVLVIQIAIAGSSLGGPSFNTPLGVQFWLLTSALYGASCFTSPVPSTGVPLRQASGRLSPLEAQ